MDIEGPAVEGNASAPGFPKRHRASLSAAAGEALTRFARRRPSDLGHRKSRMARGPSQKRETGNGKRGDGKRETGKGRREKGKGNPVRLLPSRVSRLPSPLSLLPSPFSPLPSPLSPLPSPVSPLPFSTASPTRTSLRLQTTSPARARIPGTTDSLRTPQPRPG